MDPNYYSPEEMLHNLNKILTDLKKMHNQNFDSFRKWVKKSDKVPVKTGITRTGHFDLVQALNKHKRNGSIPSPDQVDLYERMIQAFAVFGQRVAEKEKNEEKFNRSEFYDTIWFGYFFHLNGHGEAKLARVILKISEVGEAELENVQGELSERYTGTFNLLRDLVGVFNLECSDLPNKRLFIQAIVGPSPREIALAQYLTHEHNTIVSGTMVFELLKNRASLQEEDLSALLLSYKHNPEVFFDVDPSIRRFLAMKRMNYLKLPNEIFSKRDLVMMMNRYRTNKRTLFFNEEKPILFISTPTNSIPEETFLKNREIVQNIISGIAESIPDIDIKYTGSKRRSVIEKTTFLDNLELIKKSQFFVLIHPEPNAVSASTVELAWALVYCKAVIVFYKDGAIPELIPDLHNSRRLNYLTSMPIISLEEESEKIQKKIIIEVLHQLRTEYDL